MASKETAVKSPKPPEKGQESTGTSYPGLPANQTPEQCKTTDLQLGCELLTMHLDILKREEEKLKTTVENMKKTIKLNADSVSRRLGFSPANDKRPTLRVAAISELLESKKSDDKSKLGCIVRVNTSSRGGSQWYFSNTGLLGPPLKPADIVATDMTSHVLFYRLPAELDERVKAMLVDSRPKDTFKDIGGYDKQIIELKEAILLPLQRRDLFQKIGIVPPKGAILYGPPGTGKTLLARATAGESNCTFLRLAGPQLVQSFIGEGAKTVRDAFQLAKDMAPTIIFIDEVDAIGSKRGAEGQDGSREVKRTMLELLNQLDGFEPCQEVKVLVATNRIDVLDPALIRSGRLDRKIEMALPTFDAKLQILKIHCRKMNLEENVNLDEVVKSMPEFSAAMARAVCVEAGMNAVREEKVKLTQQHFQDGVAQVAGIKAPKYHAMYM